MFQVKDLTSKRINAYLKSATVTNTTGGVHKMEAQTPPRLLRLFALYENLVEFIFPLCTTLEDRPSPETPVTQCCNIVDISGVGLKQFWDLRTHMQEASVLSNAHSPETLDKIFVCLWHCLTCISIRSLLAPSQILGAPAFFPTVWGWIKKWFDPVTTSKIFIISHSEVKPTLERMIDPSNIPKKYGGLLEYEYGMPPLLDPSIQEELSWTDPKYAAEKTLPQGPMRLYEEKDGTLSLLLLGSVDGKARREKIAVIRPRNQRVKRTVTSTTIPVLATAAESSRPTPIAPAETAGAAVPASTIPPLEPIAAEKTALTEEPISNGVARPPEPAVAAATSTKEPIVEPIKQQSEVSRPDLTQQKTEFFDAPESELDLKNQNLPPSKGLSLTNGGVQEPA